MAHLRPSGNRKGYAVSIRGPNRTGCDQMVVCQSCEIASIGVSHVDDALIHTKACPELTGEGHPTTVG